MGQTCQGWQSKRWWHASLRRSSAAYAGVCIESHDRPGLERLLRYCARPPFAMDRLRKEGSKLVYRCGKQRSETEPADWDLAAQPAPDFEVDQRISW